MQGVVWVSDGGGCVAAGEGRSPGPAAHTIRRYPDTKYKAVSLKVRHPAPSDGQSSLLSSAHNEALVLPLSLSSCLLSCSGGLSVVSVCLLVCLSPPPLLSSAHNEALVLPLPLSCCLRRLCLSAGLPVRASSLPLSRSPLFLCLCPSVLSVCLCSVSLSVSVSLSLSVCLCLSLSVSVSACLCLSVSVSLSL